jgi:hypothetical protein
MGPETTFPFSMRDLDAVDHQVPKRSKFLLAQPRQP